MITTKNSNIEQFKNGTFVKYQFEGNLLKVTFTFDTRFYEKYDTFKFGNTEYKCISRPRKNDDNTWSIDVLPSDVSYELEEKYNTEYIKSLYDENNN